MKEEALECRTKAEVRGTEVREINGSKGGKIQVGEVERLN